MGRFIVSYSAAGVRFLLQSAAGQTLIASHSYATLDACKKGMRSLAVTAKAPLAEAGAPNPKCEVGTVAGRWHYTLRAPNGKAVITSPAYATRKAALRALSMLRGALAEPTAFLERPEGLLPLTVTFDTTPVATPRKETKQAPVAPAPEPIWDEPLTPQDIAPEAEAPAEPKPAVTAPVRENRVATAPQAAPKQPAATVKKPFVTVRKPARKKKSFLDRFFGG